MRRWVIIGMKQPSDDTPSVTPLRACQLPQRGSREWAVPFTRPPKNRNVAGDFHRPYETQKILTAQKIPWFPPQKRYRVGQGTNRIGTILKRK